jgi:Flp pilus assembly protein TadG
MKSRTQRTAAGTVSIFSLLGMVSLLAVGSLALDVGYVYVARSDLQNAADAAVLSGAAELGDIYMDLDPSSHSGYVMSSLDRSRVVTAIGAIAGQNRAVGQVVNIVDPAVSVGTWDFSTGSLTTTNLQPRAISALAQRTDAVNGPVGSFFARVIGRDSFNVAARSTAALTPLGGVPEGAVTLPVGISTAWFSNNSCDQPIKFHPTGTLEGCAGWHTYDQSPANASTLRNTLQGLESGAYQSPPMATGDITNFTGGTLASAFPDMQQLYETRRFDESPSDEFDALVVVYDSPGCSNPSGAVKVVGFASVTVTGVETSPENTIDAVVRCDIVHEGTGGGGEFGTLGSVPLLVQ